MFVRMWMTRDVETVGPEATLAQITGLMMRRRIRRIPVVSRTGGEATLIGIVSHSDVLHAFPANVNPFAADAAQVLEAVRPGRQPVAADLMARNPQVTDPDAPVEAAARIMRDHKIGALPVVKQRALVGLITESDIFRALVELFEPAGRAVRITFSLHPDEDVLPLLAEIAGRHRLRVTTFAALARHDPPLCVVQLAGSAIDAALEDVWKTQHRVMNVVHLA
jgi:acetoin utilization protein AcuB